MGFVFCLCSAVQASWRSCGRILWSSFAGCSFGRTCLGCFCMALIVVRQQFTLCIMLLFRTFFEKGSAQIAPQCPSMPTQFRFGFIAGNSVLLICVYSRCLHGQGMIRKCSGAQSTFKCCIRFLQKPSCCVPVLIHDDAQVLAAKTLLYCVSRSAWWHVPLPNALMAISTKRCRRCARKSMPRYAS